MTGGGEAFEVDRLEGERARAGGDYLEFLRVDALSAGLYVLEPGRPDPQSPHAEDEVYVVVAGRAVLAVGDAEHPVGPGSVVYVPRTVPHRFHDVSERLSVLVVFAPAETA
jgi:mannose-6-phosphate isomerase-like protein (cupin superfamily)